MNQAPTADPDDPRRLRARIADLEQEVQSLTERLGYANAEIIRLRKELMPYQKPTGVGIDWSDVAPRSRKT